MARMRRLPVNLAVCAGVLLLLRGTIAETIETLPSLDKLHSAKQYIEPGANETPLSKVSSAQEIVATVSPLVEDRKSNDALSVEELENFERKEINAAVEKAPTAVNDASEPEGLKPGVHLDGSLTPSPASNASKAEEIPQGSVKKSLSTKGKIESSSKLTGTNDLASVTVRPSSEESSGFQDNSQTKSKDEEARDTGGMVAPAASTKLNSEAKTREEGETRTNTERSLPLKLESASSSVFDAAESLESSRGEENLKKEVEAVTRAGSLPESAQEAEETTVLESKNSEVQDLEKVEKKDESWTISLVNDTNVNYAPRSNSSTTSGGPAGPSENNTNSVYGDSGVSHGRVGPKEEVEVVKNVTQSLGEKIMVAERTSEQTGETAHRNESESNPREKSEQAIAEANKEKLDGRTEEVKSGQEITGKEEDDQSKIADVGSNRGNREDEQTVSTAESNQSPIPRGRTIAFSLVNEFPSLGSKSTAASKEIDLPSTKKNTSTDKGLEQKPYPYLKSIVTQSTLKLSDHYNESLPIENSTTEESSPLENTIVRGDTEKKVIVTEPSVVIENSIQQLKPDHSDKSENDSLNNSTSSQALSSSTTQLLPEAGPTNGTLIDFGGPGESRRIAASAEVKSTSTGGNDIPQGSEVITTKDEGFDVTGNGITEVTAKPESPNKGSSHQHPSDMTNGTTESPLISTSSSQATRAKVAPNVEMQTDAEQQSLLIRSTLNASETSTEYPLTRSSPDSQRMTISTSPINPTTPDLGNTTTFPVTNASSNEHAITAEKSLAESVDTRDMNGTNEIPTGLETITVMNKETSTTADVEYKFVGLTEATTILTENVTEGILKENGTEVPVTGFLRTTVPGVQEISTKEYTMEDAPSTIAPQVTENLVGSEIGSTMTYDTTTAVTTEETQIASTIPPATTDSKLEDSSALPTYENQTERAAMTKDEQEFKVTTLTDSPASTTETFPTTIDIGNPLGSLETKSTINVTQRPNTMLGTTWILDATTVITTQDIETTTPTPATPTLPPRVFGSSTPGDLTTQETTGVVQNMSLDEITSLVQIVIQGNWHEVCPQLNALRRILAELLTSEMNKQSFSPVHTEQIIIHQNPCREAPPSTPTPTDTPLMAILVYVVDTEGKFDSTMTNMLPSLYNISIKFPVKIHSFLLVQEKDSGNAIAVVVVSSVAFICLVLLAGLLFIMRKRQTRFNYGERCRPVSLDAFSLDSVSAYNSVRRKGAVRSSKRSYGNPTFEDSPASATTQRISNGIKQSAIPSHPLNFASLSTFCSDVNAINEEFAGIPQVSAKIDELPAGAEVKNRYANGIPLPETRVPLQKINNDPLSEYINASYVRGPRNATRYYIACQAPMESTVTDFWRMIWEQQSKVIIMLTDLVENDVEKCTEYIPPSEVTDCHRLYGDFQVTLKKRETKEKYAISTLHLKNLENNTFREVYHIWYLWPVNGVQSDGAGLIAVILEARALQRAGPGPIVVHCSPGTGRTGTLIALDLGIRQYEITRTVDVPRVVYTIRRDRAGAVQTKEQYVFIYKALNLYATKLAGGGGLEST